MAIVKEAEFETCKHCGSCRRISDAVRGCDECKRVFDEKKGPPLSFDVHNHEGHIQVDCCSWACALEALRRVECDYFVSLPFLYYDRDDVPEGARVQDFFTAIREGGPSLKKKE